MKVNIFDPKNSFSQILRQTEDSNGRFGELLFYTDNTDAEWQIISTHIRNIDEIKNKKLIYIHQEPEGKYLPSEEIIRNCLAIISYYPMHYPDKKVYFSPPLLQWTYGLPCKYIQGQGHIYSKENCLSLQQIFNHKMPKKTKLCSMISSTKYFLPGHKKRLSFLKILLNHFHKKIDFFGFGLNPILDKKDAIDPYYFSISIENDCFDNWWTEKISDVFLGYSKPIYYGCKNINNYFNEDSLKVIDINDIDKSIYLIEECLKNPSSIDSLKLQEARNNVIHKYNMFKLLHDVIIKINKKL